LKACKIWKNFANYLPTKTWDPASLNAKSTSKPPWTKYIQAAMDHPSDTATKEQLEPNDAQQ
jgi:hypothetical protein